MEGVEWRGARGIRQEKGEEVWIAYREGRRVGEWVCTGEKVSE